MLPAIRYNMGDDYMIDSSNWSRQFSYTELIMSSSSSNKRIKNLNRQEYKEYLDLEHRHNEQLIKETPIITVPGTVSATVPATL